MTDAEFVDTVFDIFSAIISVMKTITFLSVPLFYWIVGFLIMSAVLTYVLNTAKSPYGESHREMMSRERRQNRK